MNKEKLQETAQLLCNALYGDFASHDLSEEKSDAESIDEDCQELTELTGKEQISRYRHFVSFRSLTQSTFVSSWLQ